MEMKATRTQGARRAYERPETRTIEISAARGMMQASPAGRGGVQDYNVNAPQKW